MLKRWAAAVLAVLLLVCALPGAAEALTRAELYDAAVSGLQSCFLGEEAPELPELEEIFARLAEDDYRKSYAFSLYTGILCDLDAEEYDLIFIDLYDLEGDVVFTQLLTELALPDLVMLRSYAEGRIAEHEGDAELAVACYTACPLFPDALRRIRTLRGSLLEQQYAQAQAQFARNTPEGYRQAAEIFGELAELRYRNSREMHQRALEKCAVTPTPAPTPRPTAKPGWSRPAAATSAPTAAPTATPTPTFSWVMPATPSPTPTATPTIVVSLKPTPSPDPTATPTTVVSLKPTPSPAGTPAHNPQPTESPTTVVSLKPTPSPESTSAHNPVVTPTPEPERETW